jgi:Protein of unknown function (DUF3301)
MFLSWTALGFLVLLAALAWFWQDSLATRELANLTAIDACERLHLQFLDGTVAFARIAVVRGPEGWLTLRRTYVFDYTANSIERRQGFVMLVGRRVETVGYAPGEVYRDASNLPTPGEPSQPPAAGNVLDFDQWRASHRRSLPTPGEDREDRGDLRH